METPLMVANSWHPKGITLTAHGSPTQTVTLRLACTGFELRQTSTTGQFQLVVKVEDSRGLAAADWEFLSFVDINGAPRTSPVRDVREIARNVLAMSAG
jgi:hypothetical protein